jgi:protein-S-isoprenylcysteine O-methyltransferase Ste14
VWVRTQTRFGFRQMHLLEHKIPPPIVAALVGAAMWTAAQVSPALQIEGNLRFAIAGGFALLGLVFAALGFAAFRRAKTTVNPVKPEEASSLVMSGVYRYTRNPMYVGLAALLLGWAVYLAAPWVLLGPVLFVLFITRFQIIPEERVLSSKFGKEYSEYKQRVRRWL